MGVDLKIFVEHRIDGQWVLVDLDPLESAERNGLRRDTISGLRESAPTDLSVGVRYWLEGDGGPRFMVALPLFEAVNLWHRTEVDPRLKSIDALDRQKLTLNHFGLWNVEPTLWRIVVAFSA